MSKDRWTPEQLLAELRGRERTARPSLAEPTARATAVVAEKGARAGAAKATSAPGLVPKHRRLGEVPTRDLARMLNARQRAIYGKDDRKDTRDVTNKRQLALASASVALVEVDDLDPAPGGGWSLRTTSFQKEYSLCDNERYAEQPLGCFCSGVLVAPDVIATAGHCVDNAAALKKVRFVFGFRMESATQARTTFPTADVYQGSALIGRAFTDDGTDWALVRLDRPVVGRTPVKLRKTGKVANDERLFVIGHPCGLPQKVAGGAEVRNNGPRAYFVANLDTYGGNSGSPVFSAKSNQLEGLLVRGQTDFVLSGSCYVSTVFPTTGRGGEDVTRSTEWAGRLGTKSTPGRLRADTARPKRRRKQSGARSRASR